MQKINASIIIFLFMYGQSLSMEFARDALSILKNDLENLQSALENTQVIPPKRLPMEHMLTEIPYAKTFDKDILNFNVITRSSALPFKEIQYKKPVDSPLFIVVDLGNTERTFEIIKGGPLRRLEEFYKHIPNRFIIYLKLEKFPWLEPEDIKELGLEEKNIKVFPLDFKYEGGKIVILDSPKNRETLIKLRESIEQLQA